MQTRPSAALLHANRHMWSKRHGSDARKRRWGQRRSVKWREWNEKGIMESIQLQFLVLYFVPSATMQCESIRICCIFDSIDASTLATVHFGSTRKIIAQTLYPLLSLSISIEPYKHKTKTAIVFVIKEVWKIDSYRSVVDLTSSRFQSPHVSCLAVDANSNKFTNSRNPMGPKKYASNSLSPGRGREGKNIVNWLNGIVVPKVDRKTTLRM